MLKTFLFLSVLLTFTFSSPVYVYDNHRETLNGFEGDLNLVSGRGPYGNDIEKAKLYVYYETPERVHIKIVDRVKQRYEPPSWIIKSKPPHEAPYFRNYSVTVTKNPFSFRVTRTFDGHVVFDSAHTPFVFSNQYITVGTKFTTNTPSIYGFGQRFFKFKLDTNNKVYTMWNKDNYLAYGPNMYGYQPFYMHFQNGKASGVFWFTSNAMDAVLNNNLLEMRTIGGVIDLYFFMGPEPENVVRQYQEIVGKPYMPPYWSLGFHQCRYGYPNISVTRYVAEKYRELNIPLDVMWNDIDYMNEYRMWTFHPKNYPENQVRAFAEDLHRNGMKYVVILDPGVKVEAGYEPYEKGLQMDIFIKRNDSVTPIVNKVWPGYTVFPDFHNSKAVDYWNEFNGDFLNRVPIDGLWIDMNEIAGFCNGECYPEGYLEQETKTKPQNIKLDFDPNNPPYVPGGIDLAEKTLRLDAVSKGGIEYNVHTMYGLMETVATRNFFEKARKKRAFILTRSTFPGTGHYSSHWLGDNQATWNDLRLGTAGILNANIFGIPHVGADICGFAGDTTKELCARWIQVGTFYPFARNHNDLKSASQEPWVFGPEFVALYKKAVENRYWLLPYFYTLSYKIHVSGGTFMRPLWFEFPNDTNGNIDEIEDQFMIGPSLLVSPVVHEGRNYVDAYFPSGQWYDIFSDGKPLRSSGERVRLEAPLDYIPAHLRGGHIIPTQAPALNTEYQRKNPFQILVALNGLNVVSKGSLYLDDGDSLTSVSNKEYTEIVYEAQTNVREGTFVAKVIHDGYPPASALKLDEVTVYGILPRVCGVTVNGVAGKFTQNISTLHIISINEPMNKNHVITWKIC